MAVMIGKTDSHTVTAPFSVCASMAYQKLFAMHLGSLMLRLDVDIHLPYIVSLSCEKLQLQAPCRILEMRVNEASTFSTRHLGVTATRDCGGGTAIRDSRLATRLRSRVIFLPTHLYLQSLESTFPTIYHNYHTYAYKAERWLTPH